MPAFIFNLLYGLLNVRFNDELSLRNMICMEELEKKIFRSFYIIEIAALNFKSGFNFRCKSYKSDN